MAMARPVDLILMGSSLNAFKGQKTLVPVIYKTTAN